MQENGNDMGVQQASSKTHPLMPRLAGDIASKYVLKSMKNNARMRCLHV
jgi:hypothetical protein